MTVPTGRFHATEATPKVVASLLSHGRYSTARTRLAAQVEADPAQPGSWALLALACLGCGDDAAALDAATRASALAPGAEWPHRLRSAALERLGRHGMAIDAAESAVACDPGHWAAHARLAEALTAEPDPHPSQFRYVRALRVAAEAVRLAPGESGAYRALAQACGRAGDLPAAADADAKALELAGDDAGALHDLGVARLRLGRLPAAGAAFAHAAVLDPRGTALRGSDLVWRAVLELPLRRAAACLGLLGLLTLLVGGTSAHRLWALGTVVLVGHLLLRHVLRMLRAAAPGQRRSVVDMVLATRRVPAQPGLLGLALLAGAAGAAAPVLLPVAVPVAGLALAAATALTWYGEGDLAVHPVPPRR